MQGKGRVYPRSARHGGSKLTPTCTCRWTQVKGRIPGISLTEPLFSPKRLKCLFLPSGPVGSGKNRRELSLFLSLICPLCIFSSFFVCFVACLIPFNFVLICPYWPLCFHALGSSSSSHDVFGIRLVLSERMGFCTA